MTKIKLKNIKLTTLDNLVKRLEDTQSYCGEDVFEFGIIIRLNSYFCKIECYNYDGDKQTVLFKEENLNIFCNKIRLFLNSEEQ